MQVIDRSYPNASGIYAEGRVLNTLYLLSKGWWGVGEPNRSCIREKRPYKRHIGDKYVFFLVTQLVPVRALRMLILGKARVTKDLTWALNLKCWSKVTPSIQRVLSRGIMEMFRVIWRWMFDCANRGVNRVMVDFGAEIADPSSSALTSIFDALAVGALAIWSTLLLEQETVKSSAVEMTCEKVIGLGECKSKEVE